MPFSLFSNYDKASRKGYVWINDYMYQGHGEVHFRYLNINIILIEKENEP